MITAIGAPGSADGAKEQDAIKKGRGPEITPAGMQLLGGVATADGSRDPKLFFGVPHLIRAFTQY